MPSWPKPRVSATGSTKSTQSVTVRLSRQPVRFSRYRMAASAPTHSSSQATAATSKEITANGTVSSAPNGG